MTKLIIKCVLVTMICVLAFPLIAFADDYYSNNDGYSHTRYYYDSDWNEHSFIEPCTWQHSYYDIINYGDDGHYVVYECPYCYGTKQEYGSCSWEEDSRSYNTYNDRKHEISIDYRCAICGNTMTEETYGSHSLKWVRYGKSFWYECKRCGDMPKYNGSALIDSNDADNITLRRRKTYKYSMYGYHKTRNKVKSIKISKKKICSAKRKGKNIVIKGKKKGKCVVTVKMRSGAKYVLKVKVR